MFPFRCCLQCMPQLPTLVKSRVLPQKHTFMLSLLFVAVKSLKFHHCCTLSFRFCESMSHVYIKYTAYPIIVVIKNSIFLIYFPLEFSQPTCSDISDEALATFCLKSNCYSKICKISSYTWKCCYMAAMPNKLFPSTME